MRSREGYLVGKSGEGKYLGKKNQKVGETWQKRKRKYAFPPGPIHEPPEESGYRSEVPEQRAHSSETL
jgi:hypothetical protein